MCSNASATFRTGPAVLSLAVSVIRGHNSTRPILNKSKPLIAPRFPRQPKPESAARRGGAADCSLQSGGMAMTTHSSRHTISAPLQQLRLTTHVGTAPPPAPLWGDVYT